MNPIEVLDGATSFEPSSHTIEYELGNFNFIFTDSESESYFTSCSTTTAWLRTSSVCASNGRVYHVTLLEYKLGHCVWHIYCGQAKDQHTRTFSTHSYVRVPAFVSGTFSDEYVPVKLLSGILDFCSRTPDLSTRNLSAKVTQLANGMNPKTTARERWIATHVAGQLAPTKTLIWSLNQLFWKCAYTLTFQWHMLKPLPDMYTFIEERKRVRTIHPTPGGGWSFRLESTYKRASIPNEPTLLHQISVFTSAVFVYLIPKILIGEIVANVVIKLNYFHWLRKVWFLAEISWERFFLTTSIVAITSVMPGSVVKIFSRLSGHFWRQLWLPGWMFFIFERCITEITGGPGYSVFYTLPGRGWFFQLYLWLVGAYTVLPGLPLMWCIPWYALHVPFGWVLPCLLTLIVIENLAQLRKFSPQPSSLPHYHWNLTAYFCSLTRPPPPRWTVSRYHVPGETIESTIETFDPTTMTTTLSPAPGTLRYRPLYPIPWLGPTANRVVFAGKYVWWFLASARPQPWSFRQAVYNSARWSLWACKVWLCRLHNFILPYLVHSSNRGDCARVGTLPALPARAPTTVRRRNVDVPLPTVIVMPAQIPNGPVGVAMAVEPLGLNFSDWRDQLNNAYGANPGAFPQLTPGQHCFWDTLSRFGGTPHMWYSWFMAYTRRVPNPNDPVVGPVTLAEIQEFACVSRFGLSLNGLVHEVMQAQGADRPTLHLTLERSVIGGQLHIKWMDAITPTTAVASLARILKTIRTIWPAWDIAIQNAFNNAPVDFTCRPAPFLTAVAGANLVPTDRQDIVDALVASFHSAEIVPANQEGYAFDFTTNYAAPWPPLFDYTPPAPNLPIASASPTQNWQRFKSLARSAVGKMRLPRHFAHPLAVPDMKIGASRRETTDNRARNNEMPLPPMWVTLRNELATQLKPYQHLSLPALPLQPETFVYTVDIDRAARLMADLKAHPSVLEGKALPLVLQSLDAVVDTHRLMGTTVTVPVTAYLGVFGCGKTTKTIEHLKGFSPEVRSQCRIVSHTESLRAQAKQKVDFAELRGFNFPTLVSILSEPSTGPVIFDDAGKFWGGVLDLVALVNPLVTEFVVNGDPMQTSTKFPVPGTQSEFDVGPLHAISKSTTKYATISHRGFQLLTNTLGIHTTQQAQGFITHTVSSKRGIPVVTASPRYVQVLSGYGRQAYTYGTVQGEDFQGPIEIDMTGLEGAVADSAAVVAISRSQSGFYLQCEAANPTSVIKKPPTGSDLMNAIIYAIRSTNTSSLTAPDWLVKAAFYDHMHNSMPLLPWFASIGASIPASEFQNQIPAATTHFHSEGTVVDLPVNDTCLPSDAPEECFVPETHWLAKEHREMTVRGCHTDQFKECADVNPHVHKRSDTPTYLLSVQERLTSMGSEKNVARMLACPRTDMCDAYDRLIPHPPRWTPEKHQHYVDLSIDEYCSKRTERAVLSKLKEWDPDRTGSDIKISLKNQVIKKAEKRHKTSAIPGQLIHEYDIAQTLEDAAFALFLENEIIPAFPKKFLFYRRMKPERFIEEYQSRWRVDNGAHSSDVTRWDVGCDAGMLNFDAHIMRRSHYPADYCAAYIHRRLTSRSQHGPMKTMQNSGDRYTWPINTVRRAVVTDIVLELRDDDTCAVNGDDAAVDRVCEAKHFPDSPWVFKNDNGMRVEFSGFELGGPTPYYSAEGIHYRHLILLSRDPSAQDKWYNYLDLLRHADLDTPEALAVARAACQHMHPHLFIEALPAPLRVHFPDIFV